MRWRGIPIRLRRLLRRRSSEEDLADELSSHIEFQTGKNIARGMVPEEARRQACLAFGAIEQAREECREVDTWRWIDTTLRNGRQCFRSLSRSPAFALISVLILSVSIGANVAVFSILNALLLRPLPITDAERLVQIYSTDKHGQMGGLYSTGLEELSHNSAFTGACGVATRYDAIEIEGSLRNLGMAAFSGGCFQTLGLAMQFGRALAPEDDRIGGQHVAVITDSLWHSQFAGRRSVLGRSIRIGSYNFTIVGVSAKGFTGLLLGFPEPVMVPLLQQSDFLPDGSARTTYDVNVLARLKAGVSRKQAFASLVAQRKAILEQSVPRHRSAAGRREYLSRSLQLTSASGGFDYFLRSRFAQPLYAVFGLCGAMLLLACVNLSSLLLARGLRREGEISIRLALGASQAHILNILLLENVVLVVAGSLLGITVGLAAARAIVTRGGQIFGNLDLSIGLDVRVVAFVITTMLVVSGIFATVSLWQARRLANADALKQSGRGVVKPNTVAQKVLLTVQIALTLALVTGSGLFAASVRNAYQIDFGIDPQNVWAATLTPRPGGYRNPIYWKGVAIRYYRHLLEQVESLPGVVSAAFTNAVPFFSSGNKTDVALIEGGDAERSTQAFVLGAGDKYFATLGSRLAEGEDFRRAGGNAAEPGVILSGSLARHFGGRRSMLGQHIRIGTSPDLQRLKIVGIVRDMDTILMDLNETKPFLAFIDFWEQRDLQGYPTLLIKTRTNSLDAAALRRIVERDGHEFVDRLKTVTKEIDDALVENRFLAYLASAFGVLALFMAGVGLFGLLSYQVANRTSEIGVRMALGAQRSQIRWLIFGQVVRSLVIGLAAGLVLTFAMQKLLSGFLYGITVYNPTILLSAILVMVLAALLAAIIPMLKATKISPIEALRQQ